MVGERLGVREGLDAAGTVESLRVHFSLMRSRPWVLLVLMVWRLLTVLRLLVPLLVQLLLLLLLMKRRMVRWGSVFPKVVLTGLSVSHVRAQHVGLVERGGICSGVVQVVVVVASQLRHVPDFLGVNKPTRRYMNHQVAILWVQRAEDDRFFYYFLPFHSFGT
jgi:hypothetical protein